MKNIEVYNTLNIDKDSSSIVATFTQEDDAVMEFKLFKDGQEIVLKDQTISLGAERKDGAVIEQEDGFLIKENNVLNITLKKNIIQVVGVVKIQLYLKDKSGEMASNTFNIRVNKKLLGAENVEATNDIKSLNTLVLELKNNTNKLIDDTKAKADKLLSGLQETGDNLSDTVKAKTDKIIEDTKAEVDNIKKDYEGLKKVVIDENISIKLQEDIKILQNGLKTNQNLSYEGSSISAENTLEGRTKGMSIKGLTLQNLWKPISIQWEPTNKWFNALASSINFDITGKVITVKNITNKAINFQFSKLDNNYDSQVVISSGEIKVINVTSLQKFRGVIGLESVGWENTTENKNKLINGLIVCIGEHSYLPNTYFEGLKSFGEAEQEGDKHKISILSRTENLLDTNVNSENVEDGVFYDYKTGKKNTLVNTFTVNIPLKANTTFSMYGINRNVSYWKDGVFQGSVFKEFADDSFTTQVSPNFDSVLKVTVLKANKDLAYVVLGDKEMNPYQQYKQDKKDILISAPLRSVDDVQDIMYEDNGQVKVDRKLGKYTFTGDENFSLIASDSQGNYISFLYTSLNNRKYQTKLISDNLTKLSSSQENKEGIYCYSSNFNISIRVLKSKLNTQDVEGFKAWLKANPTTIVYQLATPTIEIVENCVDIDLDTYQDKTCFNILNSLQGTLDFKVPSNIGSVVQNMAKEVNNIWDVINNLLVPGILDVNKKVALATIKII
ncbi:MAG: DUF2479 domain-containing protein [Bacillota bacterium]|nr:DUF2479 domain-containing protein [Clostridium perfringens]MDU7817306.1 DUF2479 domain-containing protein [Bacillota bacterium]DAL65996.1 MAG TPA_asm: tail protein [Caudoviricetes sp.]